MTAGPYELPIDLETLKTATRPSPARSSGWPALLLHWKAMLARPTKGAQCVECDTTKVMAWQGHPKNKEPIADENIVEVREAQGREGRGG
jgi:hypothetical protein